MNIVAIVQARTGSTRLPAKVFLTLSGKPLIWHIIQRVRKSNFVNQIVLATTINKEDDYLVEWAKNENINIYRGSEEDVLARFYETAIDTKADIIVRVTGDDPFKDPEIIDIGIKMFIENRLNFISNNNPPSFPEGLDVEVFDMGTLKLAFINSRDAFEREHVTQYMYRNSEKIKIQNFRNKENKSNLRWTIDTEIDYEMAKIVYENLYKEGEIFKYKEIIDYIEKFPQVGLMNINETRSTMYKN